MSDQLFGTLHSPMKSLHYRGGDTDTIHVNVDENCREIYANLQPAVLDSITQNITQLTLLQNRMKEISQEMGEIESTMKTIEGNVAKELFAAKQLGHDLLTEVENVRTSYAPLLYVESEVDKLNNTITQVDITQKKQLNTEVEKLNKTITEIDQAHREKLASEVNDLNTTIQTLDKEHKEQVFNEVTKINKTIVALDKDHKELVKEEVETLNSTITDLDKEHKDRIHDEVSKINTTIAQLNRDHINFVNNEVDKLEDTIDALDKDHKTQLHNEVTKINDTIHLLDTNHMKVVASEVQRLETDINLKHEEQENRITEEVNTLNATINKIDAEHKFALSKEVEKIYAVMHTLDAEQQAYIETKVSELKSSMDALDKEHRDHIEGVIKNLQEYTDNGLNKLNELRQATLDQVVADLKLAIATMEEDHRTLLDAKVKEILTIITNIDNKHQEMLDTKLDITIHEDTKNKLLGQIESTQTDLLNLKSDVEKEFDRIDADFALKAELPRLEGEDALTVDNTDPVHPKIQLTLSNNGNVTLTQDENGLEANVSKELFNTIKEELIGTEDLDSNTNTIIGAKKYADDQLITAKSYTDTAAGTVKGYVDGIHNQLDKDLENYKLEVKEKFNTLESGGLVRRIVDELPPDIDTADVNSIYLLPNTNDSDNNTYEEYLIVVDDDTKERSYELIGNTSVSIDGLATEEYVGTRIAEVNEILSTKANSDSVYTKVESNNTFVANNSFETRVQELIDAALTDIPGGGDTGDVDLSDYYTMAQVNELFNNQNTAISNTYINKNDLNNQIIDFLNTYTGIAPSI